MTIKKIIFLVLFIQILNSKNKEKKDELGKPIYNITVDSLFGDNSDEIMIFEDDKKTTEESIEKGEKCIDKHPSISLENSCEYWQAKKFESYENLLIKNYVLSKGTYGYVFPFIDEKNYKIIPEKVVKYLLIPDEDYNDILREIYIFKNLSKEDIKNNKVPKFYKCIYYKKKNNNIFMLVMEKLEKDLNTYKILGRFAKFKESEKIKTYIEMAESLRHVHCSGFAHCDVNPSNFMFKDKGNEDIRLVDFGASSNDRVCYENNPKTSSPEDNEFDSLLEKNSGYFYDKFLKERERKKNRKREDLSLMDNEIREMIEEKNFVRELLVNEIQKEEKNNNVWKIDDSLYEKSSKKDKDRKDEEHQFRLFSIKELQKQDIYALGMTILIMEDSSDLIYLLYPKPALLYNKLRASIRSIFKMKIQIKKKKSFSDYRFYHRYYTIFANVLFGIIAYDSKERTNLFDFIKQLKILQSLSEYIENINPDLKNYYQMIFIKKLKESEFDIKIHETEMPHVIFVNKIIDSEI